MSLIVLVRGGGDLVSGVALRLQRAGLRLVMTELPQPLVVRRLVSFAEAVYQGAMTVEGVTARRADHLGAVWEILQGGDIPIFVDPQFEALSLLRSTTPSPVAIVLVDARMAKDTPEYAIEDVDLLIGLGPGFVAGENCHAAVETQRGHHLGRVIWAGATLGDTGIPDLVEGHSLDRVLRAPADGVLQTFAEICDHLEPGQKIARVEGHAVYAPIKGVLRGMLHPGVRVWAGLKIGDIDPRDDPSYCMLVSDKSLAVGGGVLEGILSKPALRPHLWE